MDRRILFVAHHRFNRSPGQRYRFEQYFSYLEENGLKCDLANIISEKDDVILYTSKNFFKKGLIALNSYKVRYLNLKSIKDYDLIILFREAILTRSILFEKLFSKSGVPMIFDFDDAIWIKDMSTINRGLSWMKNENKIDKILPLCTHITCGNEYLKKYALKYNKNVTVLPSTVDTDLYKPLHLNGTSNVVKIGWVGSHTTIKHFNQVINVLKRIKQKFNNNVAFKVIGDPDYVNLDLDIKGIPWDSNKEVELFNSFDIGIMPLPDNEWSRGKCGMKGLLYMSTGKPAVISAVGVNKEIVNHCENGFLPEGEEQWYDVLCKLIEDKELREQIGMKGRECVKNKFSTISQRDNYLNLYQSVINNNEALKKGDI